MTDLHFSGNEPPKNDDGPRDESGSGNTPNSATAASETVNTGRQTAPTEATKPEQPKAVVQEDARPQSYVWLANGDVKRCFDEDLPGGAGNANQHGFWQENGKVYQIVGIYPVEDNAEGN